MKNKFDYKKKILSLIKEMIPVILGILIALFLNNWKSNRDNRVYVNKIMSAVNLEFEENKKDLEEIIEEHNQLIDTAEYYIDNDNVSIGEILDKINGFKGVGIKNTASKSIMNTRIDQVNFERLSLMIDIEEGKQYLNMHMEKIMELLYQNIESTHYSKKQLLLIVVKDMMYTEENLLEYHNDYFSITKK